MGAGARSSAEPASGLRLPERYRVRRHIATGGMASVWRADDLVLGRAVAVKVLAERFAHDPLAVRRFKREARAAARVSAHPHAVTIFDVGDIEPDAGGFAGQPVPARAFIVMEYLSGGNVADALRIGTVVRAEAMRWLDEAASALDHAHERGIVHRDIKPANFLLDEKRSLHVGDFGIARLVSEETISSTGELFGTAAYLAPEQALGREATSACDRYALAVVAFELLTGERPFTAEHFAAQARQHIEAERPRASERRPALPAEVDPVLVRGMARAPLDRYETAGEFVAALQLALDEPTAPTAPAPLNEPTAPTRRVPLPVPVARNGGSGARNGGSGARNGGAGARNGSSGARNGVAGPRTLAPRVRHAGSGGRPVIAPQPVAPGSRRSRGRLIALAALLVALAGVAAVGFSQGGSGPPRVALTPRTPATRRAAAGATAGAHHRRHPASSSSATAPPATSTVASTSTAASSSAAAPASADGLEAAGHQQLQSGDYPAAIATLQRAVAAANPSSPTYAYALYDLGDALMRSGDPQAAIPILRQRVKIPNQVPVVQQLLNQALAAAGQAPAAQSGSGGSGAGPPAGRRHAPGSGGAGLPPGQGNAPGPGNANNPASVNSGNGGN